jgi:hypothetical protein
MRIRELFVGCVLLATGGWVCTQSDPCPDQLRCSTPVADVCCPPGKPYLCGGTCSTTACAGAVACQYPGESDTGTCQLASFTATIDSVTCSNRTSSPSGDSYTVHAAGTMSGCGDASLRVAATDIDVAASTIKCGTWGSASGDGCTPVSGPTTTSWALDALLQVPTGTAASATVSIDLDAVNQPALATRTMHCE